MKNKTTAILWILVLLNLLATISISGGSNLTGDIIGVDKVNVNTNVTVPLELPLPESVLLDESALNVPFADDEFILPTLPPESCTPEWVELKTSCRKDGTILGFYVDVNDCYSLTGNGADKQAPPENIYHCELKVNKSALVAAPNYLISKDGSEWRILHKDYIEKYLDLEFIYLNDYYYRVDWKWNDEFVRDVVQLCTLLANDNEIDGCVNKLAQDHNLPDQTSISFKNTSVNQITPKEVLNCRNNLSCLENIPKNENYTLLVNNYTTEKFIEEHFSGRTYSLIKSQVKNIELNNVPYSIINGNASITKFNSAKRNQGRFYIHLENNFKESNGLQIRFGENSLLVEFNNSYTVENLTFIGNQNITRYLDIDKGSNVTSAYFNINGYYGVTITPNIESSGGTGIGGSSSVGIGQSFKANSSYIHNVSFWTKLPDAGDASTTMGLKSTFEGGYLASCPVIIYNGTSSKETICPVNLSVMQDSTYWIYLQHPGQGTLNILGGMYDVYSDGQKMITGFPISDNDFKSMIYSGQYSNNSHIEIGTADGIYEWNWTGEFKPENGTQTTLNFADEINSYLANCTPDQNNRCQVPIIFHSDTAGKLQYSNINITYHNYPRNPSMDAGNDTTINWNYPGDLQTNTTTSDFSQDLQKYLNNDTLCPPQYDTCDVPLVFNSTKGILQLSNLTIQYSIYDISPPNILSILVTPNPANESNNVSVKVNATDNVNLTNINASLLTQITTLFFNQTSKLYEGILIAPPEGVYQINITATDWKNLTTVDSTQLNVTSTAPELTLTSGDILLSSQQPLENTVMVINVTIHNYGEAPANNFIAELQVDGLSKVNNTISVAPESTTTTAFNWNTTYGNHTLTVNVDASGIVNEDNEGNNQANKTIFVSDGTPPVIEWFYVPPTVEGTPLSITINASDNINLSTVIAKINNATIVLGYNQTTNLYEGATTASPSGTYQLMGTANDVNGLTTTKQISIEILPTQADLTLTSNDVTFSPLPLRDGNIINIAVTLHNQGGTSANYSNLEFLVDNVSTQNLSVFFVPAKSVNVTIIAWVGQYGTHTLTFKADSLSNVSEFNESNNNLSLFIIVEDYTSPIINDINTPASVYVNSNFILAVNATDNVNVSTVNASIDTTLVTLTFNSSSGLYEGSTTAPGTAGVFEINVTTTDTSGLQSKKQQPLTVNPIEADLTLDASDVVMTPPNPAEPQQMEVNITLHNNGGTDASDFVVRFTVSGYAENKNLSVAKASTNSTTFNWTSSYSNHTITVNADYNNIITESNESNNIYTKDIFVLDILPPSAPNVNATPPSWTIQTTHTISWNIVNDTNGIDHYEYQIDYGNWTNIGLNTSFTTPAQEDGTHTIYVRAVDTPGNLGYLGNASLYIDNTNPNTPTVNEWHSGNNWTQHSTPYFTWTNPGDVGSGVTNYVGDQDGSIFSLGTNQSYHPNVTSGVINFQVLAQDALQHNSSWSAVKTVHVDITEPSTTVISSPTHPANFSWYSINTPLFNLNATDQYSGVYGFYYVVDKNASTAPDTMNMWTTNITINITGVGGTVSQMNGSENKTGLTDGEWYFHALAKDNVGNLGNASHYLIKIDTTSPSITNLTPGNNSFAGNNPPTIQIDYLDAYSGVNVSAIILILDSADVTGNASINSTKTIYTPSGALGSGEHNVSIQIRDNASNVNAYNWTFKVSANESEARAAIEQGAANSVLSSYQTYTDQQLYVYYLNNTQKSGRFDKVIISGNQTWAFNFLTESDTYTNIAGLYNNTLVIWENQSLTTEQITNQISALINQTKW